MKSLEIRSKSKEEAISKAIEKPNVKLDDLEIEVLENPTKGFLGFLGALAAKTGGSNIVKAVIRVTFWGTIAMVLTAIVGHLFGVQIA